MDSIRETQPSRKLNTKGCCFLCLRIEKIYPKITKDLEDDEKYTSIQYLLLHLQIAAQSLNVGPLLSERDFKIEDIQVDLCENCGHMIDRFSVLFQKLEIIQLEINYFLEKILKGISQSSKTPDLVQNYSKRMTSDREALSQLAFVDNLRKEIAKESLKKSNVPRLQLILTRAKIQPIKTENFDTTYENNERYFSEDCSPNESPPYSPNATEDCDEDVKFSITSASTSQENENSPLLKPRINLKGNKGKYSTKNLSTGMYKCNKCDKKSKFSTTIARHFKSVHLKLRYKCDICSSAIFNIIPNLKRHKKTCREKLEKAVEIEIEKKNYQFACNECGKRFDTKLKLDAHRLFVPKNVDRYHCNLCDKKFKSTNHLKTHKNAVHFGKRHRCEFCSKSFAYKHMLKLHKQNCLKKVDIK